MSHSMESKASSALLSRATSPQNLTLRLCASVAASLVLSAVWIYALANPTDKPAKVAQAVATSSVSPIDSVPTSVPVIAVNKLDGQPQTSVDKKVEESVPIDRPQTSDAEVTTASVSANEQNDEFNELVRKWNTNEWHVTPCWTAESPFGVWGAMETRSGNDFGIERPAD